MIDLVLSHTSTHHEWFLSSNSAKKNDYSDWYVWADKSNDSEPNNWLSVFGGSAWKWSERRQAYYLHNF